MKRKLLTQMLNEWKSNLWMIIELIIVVTILQCLFSILFSIYSMHNPNRGYNLDDVYVGYISQISKDSQDFIPYDSAHSYNTDLDVLLANLRNNPYVEIAGVGKNSMPYNYSFYGSQFSLTDTTIHKVYYANVRQMTPEIIRAIRLTGLHGETPDQLSAILEKGDIIVSNYEIFDEETRKSNLTPEEVSGKDVYKGNDSSLVYHVGAAAWGMQRNDYEPLYRGVVYKSMFEESWPSDMVIRVKPGKGREFTESLKASDLISGNVYISNLKSIDDMRDAIQVEHRAIIRNISVGALFLLLVIFLGFLGNFWFRTQQRTGEIAIRKVTGASNREIFARCISEGIILLAVSSIFAIPLFAWLLHTDIMGQTVNLIYFPLVPYFGSAAAIIVTAILIIAGIWAPARIATRVNPSYALNDQ